MAVTITPSANSALSSELLLSGTLLIENAKDDGTETLAVSVYNKNTGATFTGTAQVYDTSKTLTYTYANGTNMSVNLDTGEWVYQRLTTEVGNTVYTYIMTFAWRDEEVNISKTVTVETRENIVVNSFVANPLDDLDEKITGVCDIDIVNFDNVTMSATVTVNNSAMAGSVKNLSTSTDVISWTFVDGTELIVNLENKTFSYTRAANNIGDTSVDAYTIALSISTVTASFTVLSSVVFPPSIKSFTFNNAVDTDLKLTGTVNISNAANTNISVNLINNGILYKGETKTYSDTMAWEYANGSKITISNNAIEYVRATNETQDLNPDTYIFELTVGNKYGTDSAQTKVQTTIPKATIMAFSADNISDTEKNVNGILKFELPVIANNPTIKVDVAVNGIIYQGQSRSLSNSAISYEYANGSSFTLDVISNTFVYARASDDYTNADADVYSFDCSISVNGATAFQTLTVKSMAGQRFYDYEPAYPVNIQPGSVETQRTAWIKYVEENKRLYRLLNENLNYYENLALELIEKVNDFENKFNNIVQALASNQKGAIILWSGPIEDIPPGWQVCDGTNGTPDYRDRFPQGAGGKYKCGQKIEAGLPNITGGTRPHGSMAFPNGYGWGCFQTKLDAGSPNGIGSGSSDSHYSFYFDASNSNSIYGSSDTVQPASCCVYFIMKVE